MEEIGCARICQSLFFSAGQAARSTHLLACAGYPPDHPFQQAGGWKNLCLPQSAWAVSDPCMKGQQASQVLKQRCPARQPLFADLLQEESPPKSHFVSSSAGTPTTPTHDFNKDRPSCCSRATVPTLLNTTLTTPGARQPPEHVTRRACAAAYLRAAARVWRMDTAQSARGTGSPPLSTPALTAPSPALQSGT